MLDPSVDWERYREASCKRFIAVARALGHHAVHDLDELAKDLYDDVWADFLARPGRELRGAAVPYIASAMMNKLRALNRRGRSVRPTDLARADGEAMLETIASEELEPSEQVVLREEMWLVTEIIDALPAREKVAWAAVLVRDPKRKDAPLGGYRLAAAQLGVSVTRAKKLSLQANKRLRAAVEEVRSGRWCERWARSIELVAAGAEGEPEFLRHAEHCTRCRLGVVHLRRQARGAARRRSASARDRAEAGSSPTHESRPSPGRRRPLGPAEGRRRGSRRSRGRMSSERLLLQLAQRGDRHAEELLIESHEQLALQVCRGFFLADGESADLLQAARIGMWRAIHVWDPDHGKGFRPFALVLMRREVMNLVTASRTYSQMLLSKACSLEAPTSIDERGPALSLAEVLPAPPRAANDPYELARARERLAAIVAALATLSPQEREALRLTLNGLSHTQAGSRIGGDAKRINNALQRARRKLSVVQ